MAWVLLGFKTSGDAGRFTLEGPAGELALDCREERTTVTTAGGDPVGTVERVGDDGELRDAAGSVLARLAGLPEEHGRDPECRYPLTDEAGADLGTLTLLTTHRSRHSRVAHRRMALRPAGSPCQDAVDGAGRRSTGGWRTCKRR